MYQITMSSGEKYNITDEEAVKIAGLKEMKGLILITSIKSCINLSFVASIVAEDKIDRSKMTHGVLHDGTRIIKRFGEWRDAYEPDIILDHKYYPEIANDTVMSEAEYETKENLIKKILTTNPVKNCKKCKGTGYVEGLQGIYLVNKQCECVKKEYQKLLN